ncbi:uncharacterized protein PFL1_02545 [Pseudozyma flocculosa PF-1]|uniref:Profilin n=2 Tax=Pseudozyma flocculosa TaxID=84751 RepID=A0A5C3EZA9_9BASI|nr:uncharacterized protein PFL1_02545 [Pseudozyma flocculosa PF-1]EPQ29872.1 hypothetical protein PFL1_02545 [Pseudozyma flocculosa PF-1]SPO37170.1 uncharacterized protein PSFLO_02642 [Pseudozyma flocculosa]
MAGGAAVNRGPHTGSGSEAAVSDLSGPQRKSLLSNLDFGELVRLNLPPATGVDEYALFDKDDALAVHGSQPSFTRSFDPDVVRKLIDLFTALNAPAVSTADAGLDSITINDTKYTVSGPRGGQHPLELATLHSDKHVFFVTNTATLLVIVQAAPGADVKQKTNEKEGLWAAVRSFTFALTEKGL